MASDDEKIKTNSAPENEAPPEKKSTSGAEASKADGGESVAASPLAEAIGALDVLRGKGIPGGLNIRGTYNAGVTYIYGDVVMHGGSSWVATRDRPGPGWQLLASVGKRGLRGERGPAGAPGMSAAAAPNPAYWRVSAASR
jgi:hypothetical protein